MNRILNYNKATRIHIVALILVCTSILPLQAQVDELINMNLSAGAVNVTVPIYTYKTRNLSLPISLSYTPINTQSPNFEKPSEGHIYQAGFVGLGWSLKTGGVIRRMVKGVPDEMEEDKADEIIGNFYLWDESYNPITAKATDKKYDVDEDQFVFSFGDYSGTFYFYRGKWIISSDQKIEILYHSWQNKLEGFVLETPDGITYTFGNYNDISPSNPKYDTAVELTSSSSSDDQTVTAWHLIKIESPEGDQINFNYGYGVNESPTYSETPVQLKTTIYTKCQAFNASTSTWVDDGTSVLNKTFPTDDEIQNGSVYSRSTQVYLQSITSTSNPIVINFQKSLYDEMYYSEYRSLHQAYKLDKISLNIFQENNNFREFNLQYTGGVRSGQTVELLQLSTIQESGRETVSQPLSSLPPYSFIYYPSTDANSPDALQKITSPLGGSAKFEYFVVSADTRYLISKKTIKSSANDDELISEYSYESSQLSRYPLYQKNDFVKPFVIGSTLVKYVSTITAQYDCAALEDLRNATVPANLTTYTWVMETMSSKGSQNNLKILGYKEYKFRGFRSESIPGKPIMHYNITDVGAPLSVRHTDANNQLISDQTYEYIDLDAQKPSIFRYNSVFFQFMDDYDKTEKCTLSFGLYEAKQSKYMLSKLTETTSSNIKETSFTYHPIIGKVKDITATEINFDDKSVLEGIQPATNPNKTQTISYTYSVDFENWWGLNGWDLSLCHRQLDLPVEKITKKDGNIVAVELTTYQTINLTANHKGNSSYLLRPGQSYRLEIPTAIAASDYTPLAADWSTLDSKLKLHSTYTYDTMGDLIQVQSLGQPVQSFVYDANSGLPILKAIGLPYSNLMGYKTSQGLDLDNIDHINKIRKNFPISQVSSYTYHPKFGIQSISTPNGISFSKEYDAFGRTKALKDNNSNILKAFEYNNNIQ